MKRLLFIFLGIAMLAIGCNKEMSVEDKVDLNYYVRFVVDGQSREFNDNVLAIRSNDSGLQRVAVQGLANLSANPPGLALVISQPEPIIAQRYPEVPGAESPAILLRDTTGIEYTNLFMNESSGIEIVINEINTGTVRGTFKGKVSDQNGDVKEISDGAFYAPFQ